MKINLNNLMRANTARSNVLPGTAQGRGWGVLAPPHFLPNQKKLIEIKKVAALEYSA